MTSHVTRTENENSQQKCTLEYGPGKFGRRWQFGQMLTSRNLPLVVVTLLTTFVFAGCYQQAGTRYPTLGHRSPYVERKSYEFHDPFPAEDLGPNTFSRPRGFTDQRTAPRRAKEGRVLQGLNSDYIPNRPAPPANGPYGYGYPDAVPQ